MLERFKLLIMEIIGLVLFYMILITGAFWGAIFLIRGFDVLDWHFHKFILKDN